MGIELQLDIKKDGNVVHKHVHDYTADELRAGPDETVGFDIDATAQSAPFTHWLPIDVLEESVAKGARTIRDEIEAPPIEPPDTQMTSVEPADDSAGWVVALKQKSQPAGVQVSKIIVERDEAGRVVAMHGIRLPVKP